MSLLADGSYSMTEEYKPNYQYSLSGSCPQTGTILNGPVLWTPTPFFCLIGFVMNAILFQLFSLYLEFSQVDLNSLSKAIDCRNPLSSINMTSHFQNGWLRIQ